MVDVILAIIWITRNWGQTGKKDIELALAKIPPKTYVGLLRRDGNAEAET